MSTTTQQRGARRRQWLAWFGGSIATMPAWAQTGAPESAAGVDALRAGGVAVLLRHAETTPGVGDPPGLRLGDCATQRNLSDAGRAQARRIGEWFEHRRLAPAAVRSSAWCRCIDTARLAFGRSEPWPALDSFFARGDAEAAQTRRLDEALRVLPTGRFEVWVTHQVNVTALAGVVPAMGEGVLLRAAATAGALPAGRPARPDALARLAFDA